MMLPPGGMLRHITLLVLPYVALGAVFSTSAVELDHERGTPAGHVQTALRGNLHIEHRHHQPHSRGLAALQAATIGGAQLRKSRVHKTRRLSKLERLIHRQEKMSRRQKRYSQGICRGMKLKWWITIKRKCSKAYGPDSRWDRNRLDGKCGKAWNSCNTGFYAVCCTKPLGPKNLEAYCEEQKMAQSPGPALLQDGEPQEGKAAAQPNDDKACDFQGQVGDVRQVILDIKNNIKLMDEEEKTTTAPPPPVVKKTVILEPAAPSPGPMPGFAPGVPMPPVGIMKREVIVMPPPPPPTPRSLASRCDKLAELTRQAVEKIHAVKNAAKGDGIHDDDGDDDDVEKQLSKESDPGTLEAKDPDLAFSVKKVLKVGKQLQGILKAGAFCSKAPADDDDDDDVEDDLTKDPTKDWSSDEDDDDEEDEEPITKVNQTALMGLLEWESDMNNAVDKFETEVHPHGYKWWRYRYEYTIVESLVLAFSIMVKFFVMWFLHGVSFFETHKFYKTGLPHTLLRYAWCYFVFHAAALMIMVTTAYMLYVPWGKGNIFDVFAENFHDAVDGRANVPYMGYSWLYMILDVQFQLFVCFSLYSLFIVMVVSNYVTAMRDWKHLDEDPNATCKNSVNAKTLRHLESIVKRRVESTPHFKEIFKDLKLRLPGVEGLDVKAPGWHDFKLHLYLTDGLGKSLEVMVQVSLTTNIFLALCALIVAMLAHHYKVAFMYFLPGFAVIGFIIFAVGYAASRYFRSLADTDDHKTHTTVTVRGFCRCVQILLYCLFFSFARLLLSNDIFEFFTAIYLSALAGLLVILLCLGLFGGEVIKETTCSLLLPPHLPPAVFRRYLQSVVHWHTKERCYECGAEQPNALASFSKEWAGKQPVGERPDDAAGVFSRRLFSWRG